MGVPRIFGGDAEAVEAAACKAALSGFESRRHLQFRAACIELLAINAGDAVFSPTR